VRTVKCLRMIEESLFPSEKDSQKSTAAHIKEVIPEMLTKSLVGMCTGSICRELTGFARWDVMASEGIDVVGPGHRRTLDQVGDELVYFWILFVAVALGILLTFPKTQGEDLVGLGI